MPKAMATSLDVSCKVAASLMKRSPIPGTRTSSASLSMSDMARYMEYPGGSGASISMARF